MSARTWTTEKMAELGALHARLEAEGDIEGTMATLVDDPVYEFWPMGWRFRGQAATRRYYEHTIELFGVTRCMFESNFPVDKASCGYNVLWNSFKRLTAGWSESERSALFHDTATRVYRLESGD